MMEILDVEQGTPEWFAARAGLPTASKFATVMAKGEGKTRAEYMRKLAGEILTGDPMDSYTNVHMERGHAQEGEARDLYAFVHDAEIQRVGFIRNGQKGASPDSLVGSNGGLEIKTALAHIQIDRLERNVLPPEHRAQVQGSIWVAEREWWDFVSYCPKLPLLTVRVRRDEAYIANLAAEVERFNEDLVAMVERIRAYGSPEALAA